MFVLLAANSFERGATAAELIVHRNTVRYRIQRIGEADRFGFTAIPWTQNLLCLAILWNQIEPQAGRSADQDRRKR
jgi:sugar diacid utilization regulator